MAEIAIACGWNVASWLSLRTFAGRVAVGATSQHFFVINRHCGFPHLRIVAGIALIRRFDMG